MDSVSVLIPVYNPRRDWLKQAVESTVSQVPPPLEVLLVDDGSCEPMVYEHPLVRVIRRENGGVAAARNTGLAQARGEFVALLDQDDYWLPGKLAAQLDKMRPGVVLCSTASRLDNGGEVTDWEHGWTESGGFDVLIRGNRIAACTAMFRRDVALAVGGFPNVRFVDDWAMWLALSKRGSIAHVPESLAVYRLHDSNSSHDYRAMWRGEMTTLMFHPCRGASKTAVEVSRNAARTAAKRFRRDRRVGDLSWSVLLAPARAAGSLRWHGGALFTRLAPRRPPGN